MQGQRRRNIQRFIHLRSRRLRHPPPRVGGERLQIAARALGVEHAQRQRGLARSGHAGHADDLAQGDIHVYIFQIVYPRAADLNVIDHLPILSPVLEKSRHCPPKFPARQYSTDRSGNQFHLPHCHKKHRACGVEK